MQLVIAEKPSVAGDLARVLPGKFEAKEGYWEGPEHLISWAVGHLLELVEPEDYDPELKNWSLANLPILPDEFRRKARQGQTGQLRLLKKLANRAGGRRTGERLRCGARGRADLPRDRGLRRLRQAGPAPVAAVDDRGRDQGGLRRAASGHRTRRPLRRRGTRAPRPTGSSA